MDTSTFLTIVIFLITATLIALAVYLILLINEARNSLKRINKTLDRLESVGNFVEEMIIRPTSGFGSLIKLVREGIDFAKDVKRTVHHKNSGDESNE